MGDAGLQTALFCAPVLKKHRFRLGLTHFQTVSEKIKIFRAKGKTAAPDRAIRGR